MAEVKETPKKEHPSAKRFRYIRDQITPSWENITEIAKETGLIGKENGELKIPEGFRKYRKEEMKKRLQIILEGEVDDLTKIPNRKGLLRRINEEKQRLEREKDPNPPDWEKDFKYDVLFIDVNDLKTLNDQSKDKHSMGDEALKKLADRLYQSIRPGDLIGRWGGDEFVLFIHRDIENASLIFWERVSQLLQEESIWVSAGLAKFVPVTNEPIDDKSPSIKAADNAMYLAKASAKQNRDKTGKRINMMRTEKDLTVKIEK